MPYLPRPRDDARFPPPLPNAPIPVELVIDLTHDCDAPTIGDRLHETHVSWTWPAGGWSDVVSGKVKPYDGDDAFQAHRPHFVYFAECAPGEKKRDRRPKDAADYFAARRRWRQ